jgi:hypothetical protein
MKTTPEWLSALVDRTHHAEWSLGAIFAAYQALERCDEPELASQLSCTVDAIRWMSVCQRPRTRCFAADVRAIAGRFSASPNRLASIIRRVDAARALKANETDARRLLAARDREEDDE